MRFKGAAETRFWGRLTPPRPAVTVLPTTSAPSKGYGKIQKYTPEYHSFPLAPSVTPKEDPYYNSCNV